MNLYFLRVPRGEGDVANLMQEYGLDFSNPASTEAEAVLFTPEIYAAASFASVATPAARAKMQGIITQVEASWALVGTGHYDTPPGTALYPYQVADLDYAAARKHVLIGDEPGLGKTEAAITIANHRQARRILVVVPASIRYQWERRIRAWSTMGLSYSAPNTGVYQVTGSRDGVHPTAAWTIISWDLLRSPGLHAALMTQHFDLLILDEVHYAKSPVSARSRAVFGLHHAGGLISVADGVVALTGTFLPNRPREAYVCLRGLAWDAIDWRSEKSFNERFNPKRTMQSVNGRVFVDERVGRQAELQNRLRANIMVRHLDEDVRTQKPAVTYDLISVDETAAVRAALQAEKMLDIDPETLLGKDGKFDGEMATVRRLMGVAMAPQVASYLEMLFAAGEDKLVVFAWHVEVLDILVAKLASYHPLRVDGSDNARSKDTKVRQFIDDPRHHLILGNVLSLGTGTDGLQRVARHALIAEPSWVHGENVQCVKRLDREGQTRSVLGDLFVAPGGISEKILSQALYKAAVVHKTLDRRNVGK